MTKKTVFRHSVLLCTHWFQITDLQAKRYKHSMVTILSMNVQLVYRFTLDQIIDKKATTFFLTKKQKSIWFSWNYELSKIPCFFLSLHLMTLDTVQCVHACKHIHGYALMKSFVLSFLKRTSHLWKRVKKSLKMNNQIMKRGNALFLDRWVGPNNIFCFKHRWKLRLIGRWPFK